MTNLEPARSPIVIHPDQTKPVAYSDMDFTISVETGRRLLSARPENTARAYNHNWTQFTEWCTETGRTPLPATPHTLTEYVNRLIGIGLAPATIDQVIGTVRSEHKRSGYKGQPDTERTLEIFHAYKREWADQGNRVRKATPVLLDALRAMVDTCDPDTLAGVRDRAILLIGFNIMGRRSEVSRLDLSDLKETGDGLSVYIRYSKTDQTAQGSETPVPYGQHEDTCAVRSVAAWRAVLAERGITSGPLFRPIDRHGRIGGEANVAGRTATRLTGKSCSDVVSRRARFADLRDSYTFHGLRSGAATTAYAAGVPVAAITLHGRWSEKSPVVLGYIRAVDKWKNNPMKGIGL